jgi:hypothetical protein
LAQEVDPNERASNECVRAGSSSEDIVRKHATVEQFIIRKLNLKFILFYIILRKQINRFDP